MLAANIWTFFSFFVDKIQVTSQKVCFWQTLLVMIFYFFLNVIGYVCVCVCVWERERERERGYLTMGLRHKEKHFTHLFRFHSPVPPPVLFESSVRSIYWFTEHTIVSDEDGIMGVGGIAGRRHNGYLPWLLLMHTFLCTLCDICENGPRQGPFSSQSIVIHYSTNVTGYWDQRVTLLAETVYNCCSFCYHSCYYSRNWPDW